MSQPVNIPDCFLEEQEYHRAFYTPSVPHFMMPCFKMKGL